MTNRHPVVEIIEEDEDIQEPKSLRKMITINDKDDDNFNV